jgi:hypothetical protein
MFIKPDRTQDRKERDVKDKGKVKSNADKPNEVEAEAVS